ncbi:MAG: hypothetical protein COC06_08265 [Bacteroidales bacterium]|nr:MAG: hypothetical protein COC06_08265 [Bacteroidales bacterium]
MVYNTYGNLNNTETSLFLTDSLNVAFNNNTDWQDLFTQNSSIINVDASVSGSFGKNQYRVSMGYYKEDGVMVGYGLKRVSPKLYLSLNPSEKVNITVNFIPSFVDIDHGLGNGSTFPFSTWGFPSSFLKVDEDQIAIYKGETGYDEDKTTSLISNVRLNILFSKDLTFTSSYSNTYRSNRRDYLTDALLISGSDQNLAESWNYKTTIWDIENYFTYSKQIKEHSFSAILGQQASKQINESSYVSGRGVLGNTVYGLSSGNDLYAYSYADRKTRLGVFGRANYDFKGRYLFSSSYRRDASSRYNQYKHWTDFYSISGGWIISDEGFFSNLKSTINFLKFRASYGVTGNDPASYYARYNLYESNGTYEGSSFGIGSNTTAKTYNGVNAIVQDYDGYAGSKNVTWEKYPQANIGLDFSLFNNRIQVQADWYARDSENLFNSTLVAPVTSGYSYYSGNVIDVRNTGYELTLSTINLGKNSKLKWNTSLTLAFNDNYVTKLPNGGQDLTVGASWQQYTLTVGQPLFQYRVWETKGVYDTDEAVPTDPLTGSKMTFYGATIRKGDPKYVDQNGDYNIDMNDKQYAGDPNPKVAGGINNTFVYKGWSLSVFCNFILGREIWNGYVSDALNGSKTANPWVDWGNRATVGILGDINYYTGAGDTDAEYGTIVNNYSTVDRFHVANSKFIEDGSFFRIKNISLGYTVPESFVDRLGVSSLRLYGMVDNVLLLTNSTLPDPEAVGANGTSDGNNYPLSLKFTFGLTVSF